MEHAVLSRLGAAFLLALALLLVSCGDTATVPALPPDPGVEAEEGQDVSPDVEPLPAEPEGPHDARVAFEAFLEIGNDAPFEAQLGAVSTGYREYMRGRILEERAEVIKVEGVSRSEAIRRIKEILERQGKKVVIDGEFLKNFSKEADERSKALFGAGCRELKEKPEEEAVGLWFSRNWESRVLPKVKEAAFASLRDFHDRAYLFYQQRGAPRLEIAMVLEEGRFRYAGSREDRLLYMKGPERATLFDMATDDKKVEAAETDLQTIVSALLEYKRHMERYPTGIEGFEALFSKPPGVEGHKWLGPYARNIHDPWGRRFRLAIPGRNNPDFYDIWSAGPDGRDGTEDDVKNW